MKIAVIHPNIMAAGGAEVTGLMVIDFFQRRSPTNKIEFITDNAVDFNALNEKFSTSIDQGKIRIIRPYLCRLIGKLEPRIHLFAKLQLTLLTRYVRKHKDEYGLVISTKQEADFGKPGIQFLHHEPDGYHIGKAYLWVLRKLGRKKENIGKNITISPSKYIKMMYDGLYGSDRSIVIYPAIRKCPEDVPWDKRENGFVMVGHIDEMKGTDRAIELMDMLRNATGADLHLHIVGTGKGRYFEKVKKMVDERSFVSLEGFVTTERYFKILTTHKYGIHMRENEPSAVTVRELVDCGEIVFAHNSGGTSEILNYNARLLFGGTGQALTNMMTVLLQKELQKEILMELRTIKFNTRADWEKEFTMITF